MHCRPTTRPRWPKLFRFSLRTLFVFMTLVACAAGWFTYYRNWARARNEYMARHWLIGYTEVPSSPWAPGFPWGLSLLGEKPVPLLTTFVSNVKEVEGLERYFPEAKISWIAIDADPPIPNEHSTRFESLFLPESTR